MSLVHFVFLSQEIVQRSTLQYVKGGASLTQSLGSSPNFLHIFQHLTGFLIVGDGEGSNPTTKTNAPHGAPPPPLKNEASPTSEKQTHPLKHELPFHEMIPRKTTINNNLKSS